MTIGAILYGVAFIGFMLRESYLEKDRDRALQDLNLKIATAQDEPFADSEWKVLASDDPASGKKIGTATFVSSNGGLCSMSVEHRIGGERLTIFYCEFEFRNTPFPPTDISIKFSNNSNVYTMKRRAFEGTHSYFTASSVYVRPDERKLNYITNPKVLEKRKKEDSLSDAQDFFKKKNQHLIDKSRETLSRLYSIDAYNAFRYDRFINSLISAKTVAIEITPTVGYEYYDFYNYATATHGDNFKHLDLAPVWIKFSLKGAKEAIAKLGKELE